MFASIIYIDDEVLLYVVGGIGLALLFVAVATGPHYAPPGKKINKVFAGLAISIVAAFAFALWLYVRSV